MMSLECYHVERCGRTMTLGGPASDPYVSANIPTGGQPVFNLIKQFHRKHRAADTQARWPAANNNNNSFGPFEWI